MAGLLPYTWAQTFPDSRPPARMTTAAPLAPFASATADQATVHIDLGERSYPIRIAAGLLGDAATYAGL
ncbi:MAG: hypothetical protein RR115_09320, partial [Hydrogenoanaerobacterium sp.]